MQFCGNYTELHLFYESGYQDSNLGPPAPKAGALTGLRYTPSALICEKRCKGTTFFYVGKFFAQKKSKWVVFFLFMSFFIYKIASMLTKSTNFVCLF